MWAPKAQISPRTLIKRLQMSLIVSSILPRTPLTDPQFDNGIKL